MKAHSQVVSLVERMAIRGTFHPTRESWGSDERTFRPADFITPMRKAGFKRLGSGCYGAVFSSPVTEQFVIKLASDGGPAQAYGAWIRFVQRLRETQPENITRFLPKVLHAEYICGVFVVVLEPLKPCREQLDGWADDSQPELSEQHEVLRGKREACDTDSDTEDCEVLYHLMEAERARLNGSGGGSDKVFMDMHPGNVMLRADGQLVITDPWS